MNTPPSHGTRLREAVATATQPMIGVYDVFSATVAARQYRGLFLSGYGFAASYLGLPDIGFIAWTDMLAYVGRIRSVLPEHHLLVDIDDGYGDPDIAAHVVARMEQAGASGVVLEDQQRPRRCGHYDGKQLLPLEEYLKKLRACLEARDDLFIVARTDAKDPEEVERRVTAFARAGADAVLAEALPSLDRFRHLRSLIDVPLVCNQLAGGKTPPWSQAELSGVGVGLIIYSTPCLFAAQDAIQDALAELKENGGKIQQRPGDTTLPENTSLLVENWKRRVPLPPVETPTRSTATGCVSLACSPASPHP
ncbi:MAG: carboxyvinyl-carboxyphosphonate phosphorylmutase [Verrucomicrobia bacterium]|nr:MAG: carboxyvinyl-carboxyphosphonate phosphorylmutase [Verrucomicrobiota bacterium]